MKTLFTSVFKALVYIICVLILGAFVPFIVATICYWVSPTFIPFRECIANAGFIIFTLVGILVACIYLSEEIKK